MRGSCCDIDPGKRLHSIGVDECVRRPFFHAFNDVIEGLNDSGFVVGSHHRDDGDFRTEGPGEIVKIELSEIVDPNHTTAEMLDRVQYRMMLDRGANGNGGIGSVECTKDGEIVGFGSAATKDDLGGLCPEGVCDDFTSIVYSSHRLASLAVSPRWVAKPLRCLDHRLDNRWAHRSTRGPIEIRLGAGRRHAQSLRRYHSRPDVGTLDSMRPDAYGQAFADVYDRWYDGITDAPATARAIAGLAPGGNVLELGVGTGRLATPLAELGLRVVGLDASSHMLQRLRAKQSNTPGPIAPTQADMAALPFTDATFDAALVAYNTFLNLSGPDQARCMADTARCLKPGGYLAIEAIVAEDPPVRDEHHLSTQRTNADEVVLIATRRRAHDDLVVGAHLQLEEGTVTVRPWQIHYRSPTSLDVLAASSNLALIERWANWHQRPYDGGPRHISVYRRP